MINLKPRKREFGKFPTLNLILNTTSSLVVLGLFVLILVHTAKISYLLRENIKVFVYLDQGLSKGQQSNIYKKLKSQVFILKKNNKPQISFISKEKASDQFVSATGEKFWEVLDTNPLRDTFVLSIDFDYQAKKTLKIIKKKIEKIDGVFEVSYVENLSSYINKNITKVSIILGFFSVILLITLIVLINNTIKIAIYSHRFIIRSMQLVGALPTYIIRPYTYQAIYVGLISGILSNILIIHILNYAITKSSLIAKLQNPIEIFFILIAINCLGILIDYISTYRYVVKYLKCSFNDLY